jgi:hypothetical protein
MYVKDKPGKSGFIRGRGRGFTRRMCGGLTSHRPRCLITFPGLATYLPNLLMK